MAVIIRDRLTGEAKDIATKGIQTQLTAGNAGLIELGQRRSLISAQQQALVANTNATLGQVQDNIYKAQRAAKAESAMLGFASDVSALREAAEVQDMVAQELTNVINQSEQGAITIAGEQSAINKAEVQLAAPSILEEYADVLIEQGKAKQDIGRQVMSGMTGALTGAIGGLIGGKVLTSGAKTILSPTLPGVKPGATGLLKKGIAGAALGGIAGLLVNQLGNMSNIGNENYGTGEEIYNNKKVGGGLIAGLSGVGATLGLGLGHIDKKLGANKYFLGYKRHMALQSGVFTNLMGKKATKEAVETLGSTAARKSLSKAVKSGASRASGIFKMNAGVAGATAGIGALIGGITAGMDKKYTLDLDAIRNDDTFQQFSDFGIDVEALKDIVYNK